MIFGMPLLQMLVLVFAATFDMKKIDMVVVDKDLSETSRELVAKFDAVPFYNLEFAVPDETIGEDMLLSDDADAILVIPPNMERNLIRDNKAQLQLLVNAIDGNSAQLIYSYSSRIIGNFNKNLISEWKGIPEFTPPTEVKISESYWYNPELDYHWFMAPGILAVLVTVIGMFMSGMNLVREKEIGTIEQLNVTPIKKYQFIIGKLVPFWVIALFDLCFRIVHCVVGFRSANCWKPVGFICLCQCFSSVCTRTGFVYFNGNRHPAASDVYQLLFYDDFYNDGRNFHSRGKYATLGTDNRPRQPNVLFYENYAECGFKRLRLFRFAGRISVTVDTGNHIS